MKRIKYTLLAAAAAVPLAAVALSSAAGPNLVKNGDFSNGVSSWYDFGTSPVATNGTMQLTNAYAGTGNSYYGAEQCIKGIQAGQEYVATGDVFVANDQPARGMAGLYFHFRDDPNCNGNNLGGGHVANGYSDDYRGKWVPLQQGLAAPAGAKSLIIVAAAVKEPKVYADSVPEPLVVQFDNITLKTADVIIVKPTATPTQKPDPQPTAVPTAIPTAAPTDTPKDQSQDAGDVVSNDPQAGSTPQAPNTGDSQPGDANGANNADAGTHDTTGTGIQVIPAGSDASHAPAGADTSGDTGSTPAAAQTESNGMSAGFIFLAAGLVFGGIGLVAAAVARRRRTDTLE